MNIQERLKVYIDSKHINFRRFEDLCGLSNGAAVKISSNTRFSTFDRISKAFPDLNIEWLKTGEGNMIAQNKQIFQELKPNYENQVVNVHMVPLVPMEAVAGSLVGFSESADLSKCRRIPCPQEADLAIQVSGDSMSPEIESGTLLYIKRINERAFIPYGNTLVLDTENGVVVKKVFPSEKEGFLTAKSVNPIYPPFEIDKTSIYGIYRVIGKSVFTLTI